MNEINKKHLETDRQWIEEFYHNICLQVGYAKRQNRNFMKEILRHIPKDISNYLRNEAETVMDSGCGMGFGTSVLNKFCKKAKIFGFDVCDYAIEKANEFFPNINFIFNYEGEISGKYDVVISSHCLEHYVDPLDLFIDQLKSSNKYVLIMTPHNENPLCFGHHHTITENTLPKTIEVDGSTFEQVFMKIVNGVPPFLYLNNIIFVYKKV